MALTPLGNRRSSLLRSPTLPDLPDASALLPTTESVARDSDHEPRLTPEQQRQTALAIRRAAAKARNEPMPCGNADEHDATLSEAARAIIIAGRKRRGEI
jgi:hypothetical protein